MTKVPALQPGARFVVDQGGPMRRAVLSDIDPGGGIRTLRERTRGNPSVCIAVLDGLVDLEHPCFQDAQLQYLPSLVARGGDSLRGPMAGHGTHVASVLFGQPGTPVEGLAPGCRGLLIPVFSDRHRHLSQMDLARGIIQAVEAGAHVINISGGQPSEEGEADGFLQDAVRLCQDSNVLIVAAAGNDGCRCLHVPAALPPVLAVGALDEQEFPMQISNWGAAYREHGVLAAGANVRGALPGGGTCRQSGTSFATPIVVGVAALLLSLQLERGEQPDPAAVRMSLLKSALPCRTSTPQGKERCLAGRLNVPGAMKYLTKGEAMSEDLEVKPNSVEPSGCGCGGAASAQSPAQSDDTLEVRNKAADVTASGALPSRGGIVAALPGAGVRPSHAGTLVYSLGTLGYDFGSEARRDSFKQLMPAANFGGIAVPANPHDARQMADYLKENLSEARSLIWTLNLELTPLYAVEPVGPFARDVYQVLQRLLDGQIQAETSAAWIERVSIPARLSGRAVRLFSGQVVPVLEIENTRGLYGWNVNMLQEAAIAAVKKDLPGTKEAVARKALTSFLYQVYYKLRNLGQSSRDRALNFAATNAFQVASVFSEAVGAGMELDDIQVGKSPFCRMDSDCWDVTLGFFDPENLMRARKRFQFTIDVSDVIPVSLGEVRSWSSR